MLVFRFSEKNSMEETMPEDNKDEEQEKGFVVRDKRFSVRKEKVEESEVKQEKRAEESPKEDMKKEVPLPEVSFVSFLFSLSTSALIQLGEIQDPLTQQFAKNLPLAKQTIDIIGMLKEKTKGNLDTDEEKLIEHVLYDLRIRYVKAT
jgi:hypothetical protein